MPSFPVSLIIPTGVRIAIQTQNGENLFSSIIGVVEGKYIIIDMPKNEGRQVPLKAHSECVVRFIHDGDVMGFVGTVWETTYRPAPLVFLRYPSQIERKSLRSEFRHRVSIECAFMYEGIKLEGTIVDLSKNGCGINAVEKLNKGSKIYLSATLPNNVFIKEQAAEIRNCMKTDECYRLGVLFYDTNPSLEEFINIMF